MIISIATEMEVVVVVTEIGDTKYSNEADNTYNYSHGSQQ